MAFNFWITPGIGDWSDASNWSNDTVPTVGDVDIDQAGVIVATNIGIVDQTVWLDQTSSAPASLELIGSSLGPDSALIINETTQIGSVTFHNSALQGLIFAASGDTVASIDGGTSAVNYGEIGAANLSSPTAFTIEADGAAFGNAGTIVAGPNGGFTLGLGQTPGATETTWNTGTIEAANGGNVQIGGLQQGATSYATVLNLGQINADAGFVDLQGNVVQSSTGVMNVTNDGTIELDGTTTAGTIDIQSGMLDFGGPAVQTPIEILGAFGFQSTIAFTGSSGILSFGTLQGISETFDASTDKLFITAPFEGTPALGAAIQLAGSYNASDFAVSGSSIVYTAHTIS